MAYEVIVRGGRHSNRAGVLQLRDSDSCARQLARDLTDHHAVPYHSIRASLLVDGIHLVTSAPHQLVDRAREALKNDERRTATR